VIPPQWSPPGHEVYLMAKPKSKTQKQKKTGKRGSRPQKTKRSSDTNPQLRYAQLLHAPDNGTVPPGGVYDGELGNFRTFVSTLTPTTGATINSGFLAFCPATGNGFIASSAGSNVAMTFALLNTGFPGAAYLNANAAKSRGIAAKLELIPSAASITTITGEAAAGVTTNLNFVSSTTTVDHLFDIAKAYGPLQRRTVRSSWFPSGLDHTYSVYNSIPGEDFHWVYVAYRGWPVNTPISIRISYVVEYTVKNTIGIPPSGLVSTPVHHQEVIQALQSSDPHWHHSLMDEAKEMGHGMLSDVGVFARHMLRTGLSNLGSRMLKQAPRALPLLLA